MNKFILMLSSLFSLLTLVSCGGSSGGGGNAQRQDETTGSTSGEKIIYDSEILEAERTALDASTEKMKTLVINGSGIRSFPEIFGGNSSENVVNYFETRVTYALSSTTAIQDRIYITDNFNLVSAVETLAINQGVLLWYLTKANEPDLIQVKINDELLNIPSTRIGVVQFGQAYVRIPTIQQVTTLIHEARHSDCTGGILASDIERFRNGQVPLNHPCGHTHELCPPGHEFAGLYACDSHPWGSYAVGGIYAGAIALECSSCTQTEKTIAEAVTLDSFSRLLYSVQELLDGVFGPPDMSSSNQVR